KECQRWTEFGHVDDVLTPVFAIIVGFTEVAKVVDPKAMYWNHRKFLPQHEFPPEFASLIVSNHQTYHKKNEETQSEQFQEDHISTGSPATLLKETISFSFLFVIGVACCNSSFVVGFV